MKQNFFIAFRDELVADKQILPYQKTPELVANSIL